MENVATTMLDFILSLLNDPEAMASYLADRDGTLSMAGLGGCGDEVDAALTSAGAGHSLYYAPAKFHYSDWSDDRDVVFVNKHVSDDDGIDDSFNTIVNESFNDNIVNSFNTNTNTTINDNDFTNNGVIIDGDGNTVDNSVSDDDTTITNVNSNNTTVEGDVIEGDVIGGDDNSIETNGGDGAGSGAIVDASGGDGGDGGDGGTTSSTQTGLVNVGDVGLGVGVGLLGDGTGVAEVGDSADGGDGGEGGDGGDVTFTN
jgi:hypothetical protein